MFLIFIYKKINETLLIECKIKIEKRKVNPLNTNLILT